MNLDYFMVGLVKVGVSLCEHCREQKWLYDVYREGDEQADAVFRGCRGCSNKFVARKEDGK